MKRRFPFTAPLTLLWAKPTRKRRLVICTYAPHGWLKEAEQAYDKALAIYRAIDAPLGEAKTQSSMGGLYVARNQWAEAEMAYTQLLALFRAVADRLGEATAQQWLGMLYMMTDRVDQAEAALQKALFTFCEIDDRQGKANTQASLSQIALSQGKTEEALATMREVLQFHQRIGDIIGIGRAFSTYEIRGETVLQTLALGALAEALTAIGLPGAASAAMRIARSMAATVEHPLVARFVEASDEPVPAPEEIANAWSELRAALASCEAELEAAGKDPYALP